VPARAAIRPGPVRGAAGDATGARARGRLAFTVFSEIPAYYAALAGALARPVSGDAATSGLSRYMLREATTGRQLVEDAGFGAIEMHLLEVMRRMPASPASVVEAMARAPYGCDVAAVEDAVRQAIGREVSAALQAYRDRDEVVIPHRSHLVRAQVSGTSHLRAFLDGKHFVCRLNRSIPWTRSADTPPERVRRTGVNPCCCPPLHSALLGANYRAGLRPDQHDLRWPLFPGDTQANSSGFGQRPAQSASGGRASDSLSVGERLTDVEARPHSAGGRGRRGSARLSPSLP
jgi:hypothetical protein